MTTAEQLFIACLKYTDQKTFSMIQKDWLEGEELRQYRCIVSYYREHGELLGLHTFCTKFKLDSSDVDSKPSFYLNALKERFIITELSDKVPKILRGLKSDPRPKLTELQSLVAALTSDSSEVRDVLYSDDTEQRKLDYEERMRCNGVTYLSMGNNDLDKTFYGYRKQDLITIGGRAGQGKTWLLIYLAYLLECTLEERSDATGETFNDILFITNEMGSEEIKERLDCIRFRLPYESFLKGSLTKRERARYYKGLSELKEKPSRIRLVYSCQTLDELTTLVGIYQPCAVFVDGSYMMEPRMQEGWEKITFITRGLKRLAKNTLTPIVNTTQLKKGTGKGVSKMALDGQDDFAYSSSYTQDSDIAFRLFQDADMKFHSEIGAEVVKGRRVVTGTTIVFKNDLDLMDLSLTLPIDDDEADRAPKVTDDY